VPNWLKKVAIDTGAFVALLRSNDKAHHICLNALRDLPESTSFITTESCLVETMFLLPSRAVLRQQLRSIIEKLDIAIVPMNHAGLARACDLMDKYSDLPMDFAHASLVIACEDLHIRHVMTLDRKDFSMYRPSHCPSFKLLPSTDRP
jgi:uncharacterized protein